MSILAMAPSAVGAQTATQAVTFSVVSSSMVTIGNLAATSREAVAPAAKARTSAKVAAASYAVATNENDQKITASLDAPVPQTLLLSVALGAPRGAVSGGFRRLSTTATDVVTGITRTDGAALPMRYQWKRVPSISMTTPKHRVVTYTITAGS
jgi:hypothetical protein